MDAQTKVMPHYGKIKPGKVKNLGMVFITKQFYKIWGSVFILFKLHQMRVAITIGNLHHAKAVALVIKPHGFGINGNISA